jgi:large-conductance mechanosensitive channel
MAVTGIGVFYLINTIINFLIIAAVVFFFIVLPIARMNARHRPPNQGNPVSPVHFP